EGDEKRFPRGAPCPTRRTTQPAKPGQWPVPPPSSSAGWPFGGSVARTTPRWTAATCSGWAAASPATASVAKSAWSLKRYVIGGFLRRLPRDRRGKGAVRGRYPPIIL